MACGRQCVVGRHKNARAQGSVTSHRQRALRSYLLPIREIPDVGRLNPLSDENAGCFVYDVHGIVPPFFGLDLRSAVEGVSNDDPSLIYLES